MKVTSISSDYIRFNNGMKLMSEHMQDCCEHHYLSFDDLNIKDFDGLEFDLTKDEFFTRIEGYGIALNPIVGFPIRIPGYGENNGYYSSDINLVIIDGDKVFKSYDITECQLYNPE